MQVGDGIAYTKANEGCRLESYLDTLGVPTIGVGHTGPGIVIGMTCTQAQADAWFDTDYWRASDGAAETIGAAWGMIDDVRKAVLVDQCFQLGKRGLANFRKEMLAARVLDWPAAAHELMDSRYARQTPNRAVRNRDMLLTGQWPEPF